jgi:serine kinase of HPr protein (carbohydrate metabolism regulator)
LLLRGPSGSGKSDLALRLIDAGAALVADDLCEIRRDGGRLLADLPAGVDASFQGRIEARGQGLLSVPHAGPVPLVLVADLKPGGASERLPEQAQTEYLGLTLPLIVLDPFQASAAARLRLVARQLSKTIMRPP